MKKKVIFAVATGLFALAMVFNMNVLQSNSAGDVSLESIAVMAQAQNEFPNSKWIKSTCNCYRGAKKIENYAGSRIVCIKSPVGDDSCTSTQCSSGSNC
ncbi:MAG TPA: hypothetical protein VLZ83_06575 [Edaphocola sp.]|nr:hypothetical protein [Edaphocola sp.]